ncbi:MAG TPA: hemolysin family protein [Verrucomicrobiota bacterium]|nr:hemolysin family protein [Verrucomicrobiota bacterium]
MDWELVIFVLLRIIAVIGLVLLNGFFVATEFALVKVRHTQLEPLANRGQRRAKMALHLTHHLDAYLSACQLGITLASLALGWIGEPVFTALLEPVFNWAGVENKHLRETIALGFGFGTITFLHIVVGEMAPKSVAIRLAMPTAMWIAYPMKWFYVTMYPFIWVLNQSALMLLRWCGLDPAHESEGAHTEDELRLVLAASQKHLGASAFSRHLVQNALELRHRVVREVMRPRQQITALDTEASITDCVELAEKTRYSRFPLCTNGDLDKALGVVHIKDLYALKTQARSGAELKPVLRKLIYVPETARLEKLLQLFLERKLHVALVVDEYGGTMGLVSLENILEELVGQIQDEFDQEKPPLIRTSETSWEADGALPVHELEELIGERLQAEDVTTASGWITHRLGGFPKPGDTLNVGAFVLRVEEMDGTRVAKLKLTRQATQP